MEQSPNSTPQKTSPLIIKLSPLSNEEPEDSTSDPNRSIQTSPKAAQTVKMKTVALTFCRLSKDGVLSKAQEPLKMPSALSLKLGAALKERITLKSPPSQTVDTKSISSSDAERQSLTTHLSKLADDKLDFVDGGDKSKDLQLAQPPLTMQPSNLLSDDLLDARYGGGGYEPSVVQESSSLSTVASSSAVSVKSAKKHLRTEVTEMEPSRKKVKFCDTSQVELESLLDSSIGDKTGNTKRAKIIQFKSSPGKKACVESSVYLLEKDGVVLAQSPEELPHVLVSSLDEKSPDVSVKVEGAKEEILESDAVKSEHPHFLIAYSSNNIDQKDSNVVQKLNEDSQTKILHFSKNLNFIEYSALLNDAIGGTNIKTESNDAFTCPVSIESAVRNMLSNSEESKVDSYKIAEMNRVKNEPSDNEEKSNTVNNRNKSKVGSFGSQVCPRKLSFEGRFKEESNKLPNIDNENKIDESNTGNITDTVNSISNGMMILKSSESVVDNNVVLVESDIKLAINNSKVSSENLSQINTEIEDNDPNSKQTEFDEQFLGEDGNEQLGTTSDESNQIDSRNCNREPEIEFDILDEFESNDNDPEPEMRTSDSESEISADEIDAMLEEGLGDYGKPSADNQHEVKEKVILKARGKDHFEVLPEGWIEVTHNSGIPIYLHKQTRVCCVSKPYFLGPGSTRKHEIPISAIPCLHYIKELEKEKLEAENKVNGVGNNLEKENGEIENPPSEGGCPVNSTKAKSNPIEMNGTVPSASNDPKASNLIFPSAKLESVKEVKVSGSLDALAVREYCQKRFEFQTITVKRFKTWCGRRKHQKQMRRKQRPFLPDNTQLITCPLPSNNDKSTTVGNTSKREFIMNPIGKSPVCILHEYVQHTLRVQPKYIFKELESASTPYGAVVIINEMEYGTGYGSSKKVAKSEAAKSALEVLIPKIKTFGTEKRNTDDDEYQDVEFFDQVRVEDPRISDLSVKAGQPFPYQILLECLKRNYGMGDTEISIKMKNLKHQKNEFIMKVGKHKATVVCKNKRDGKHRASQSILQQLHPHINSWGSLLRMYGKGSCKTLKEKKEEEQRITELQSKACVNKPNVSILNKLKEEMMKYREKMKSKKPIGKLIPERMQLFSVSDSNLKSIEL